MLSFMHEAEPYGHLRLNGQDIDPKSLARMVGTDVRTVRRLLSELEAAGVYSLAEPGTIFSRRMVRDQQLREKRAQYGYLSEKHQDVPRKKDRGKDTFKDTLSPSLDGSIGGSPSSSSSSSSSKKNKREIESSSSSGETETSPLPPSKRKAVKVPLPEAFAISDELRSWATARGFPADLVEREFEKFCERNKAKGETYADWNAAFRSWLIRSSEFAPSSTGRPVQLVNGSHRAQRERIPL
jgi:hypothetical protein